MSRHADKKLQPSVVPVRDLRPDDIAAMFRLMRAYYDAVTEGRFRADLMKKDVAILLRDRRGGELKGFSTLASVRVTRDGRRLRGVFSGDTVIDRPYWGQTALGKAFLHYLFREKLRRPLEPLYWLLISKGYKTYLMMANNFAEHYPRYERPTPPGARAVMDAFYGALFPDSYDPHTGLIHFPDAPCRLKSGVAGISGALRAANPRIDFFESVNPGWRDGVELACLARMTFTMPLAYGVKTLLRQGRTPQARALPALTEEGTPTGE